MPSPSNPAFLFTLGAALSAGWIGGHWTFTAVAEPQDQAIAGALSAVLIAALCWARLACGRPAWQSLFVPAAAAGLATATTSLSLLSWSNAALLASGAFILTLPLAALAHSLRHKDADQINLYTALPFLTALGLLFFISPLAAMQPVEQSLINAIIATNPISFLASLLEHDYLRSAWFYSTTRYPGLQYVYPPVMLVGACYAALAALIFALSQYPRIRRGKP